MKIAEITSLIEEVAPLAWQESYDNAGLQVGNNQDECNGVLLCIDVTPEVVREAQNLGCNLIISHHPLLFKGLKSITGKTETEQIVIDCIQARIALYAAHTNLDNAPNGVNYMIARKLELEDCRILDPSEGKFLKLAVYVPKSHDEKVKNALFEAGAGEIGNYSQCAYTLDGIGQYKANVVAKPYIGEAEKLHTEPEAKIEVIVPVYLKNKVVQALLSAHPYEEPAYDLIPLLNANTTVGSGVIGNLKEKMSEKDFLSLCKEIFHIPVIKHSRLRERMIQKIALCGGAGSFLIPHAIARNADVFITGEIKYHDFFGNDKRILLTEMGHYETEQYTKDIFCEIIRKKFPTFAIHFTKEKTNPINYF